jgi:hypothetical protein
MMMNKHMYCRLRDIRRGEDHIAFNFNDGRIEKEDFRHITTNRKHLKTLMLKTREIHDMIKNYALENYDDIV